MMELEEIVLAITIHCLIICALAGLLWFVIYFTYADIEVYSGNYFCQRQGYDGVDILNNGMYSEYFGKVTCYASHEDKRVTKTFKAKERFGRIVER